MADAQTDALSSLFGCFGGGQIIWIIIIGIIFLCLCCGGGLFGGGYGCGY